MSGVKGGQEHAGRGENRRAAATTPPEGPVQATNTIPDRVFETETGSSGSTILTGQQGPHNTMPDLLQNTQPIQETRPLQDPHVFQSTPAGADGRLRVAIADDHLLMAQGLAKLLGDDFQVIAVVNNGPDLLAAVTPPLPDLVLVDVSMPQMSGMEVTLRIRNLAPECKVILISMYGQAEFVREAFRVGASGYLLKSSAGAELRDAIREVVRGNVYVSPDIAKDVLTSLLTPKPAALSPREREILALVAEGYSAKEIASRLHIAVKTAQFHRNNIMTKLGIHSTAQLTKYALGHGIVAC